MTSRKKKVDGLELHFLEGGMGPTVVLIHGYAQTSRMWRPLMRPLMDRFSVIAPDLPGIGDSEVPEEGADLKTAAERIHSLVKSLGVKSAAVVGHDIGLMVAYAYASLFPSDTNKLVVMDAFLPGVGDWGQIYNDPSMWHFRFNGPTPEALVEGRERTYFESLWNGFAADEKHSVPEEDRRAYVEAYSRPGRMRAGWAYFASLPEMAKAFQEMAKRPVTMPVLSIGGEKSLGPFLGQQMKAVAPDLKTVVLKDAGHWILEEQFQETSNALLEFLEEGD